MSAFLIAIEGIDGSGKGTQAKLLQSALSDGGIRCALVGFPRYGDTQFGKMIGDYLNGAFGSPVDLPPEFPALLFAGDRYESLGHICKLREEHDVVVFDRYVPSNLAHQAGKVGRAYQATFIHWVESLEYDTYRLPRPNLIFWLDMPVAIAQRLIHDKAPREYTQKSADVHEADLNHLTQAADVYRRLSQSPEWYRVDCSDEGQPRSPEHIQRELFGEVVARISDQVPVKSPG